DLGLSWEPKQLAFGLLLWMAGTAGYTAWSALTKTILAPLQLQEHQAREIGAHFFGAGVSIPMLLFLALNPFFEEIIARAYVITELRFLPNNVHLAVAASVVLQMSYHLYQGVPAALASWVLFLLFSLYYAKTRSILAPIVAHFLVDAISFGYYIGHARPT